MAEKRKRASLTLEASVVLPWYMFFFICVLSILEMMQTTMEKDYEFMEYEWDKTEKNHFYS